MPENAVKQGIFEGLPPKFGGGEISPRKFGGYGFAGEDVFSD